MSDDDQKALFMTWLEEHGAAVVKVARAYTRTNEECQDLAQDILLQAWRSLPRFKGESMAATWFYRVALNTAMAWRRDATHRRQWHQPLLDVHLDTVGAAPVDDPQQRETVERLYEAIRQLPKPDAALVLLYLDDLSYREIAEILGISENYVGVKLNRAKKALGALMRGEGDEP